MKVEKDILKSKKSITIGLLLCFVAMIAIGGMITLSGGETKEEEKKANAEEERKEISEKDIQEEESESVDANRIQAELESSYPEQAAQTGTPGVSLSFSETDVLSWPVDGNVILSFSMDRTVYFATLDQYQYNPAMIISADVGDAVYAATAGQILSVETGAKTGVTITMSLGNGYELVYGQVKEVCVCKGDYVSSGDVLGYVSEPTKYYSVEGPNLYFQLLKDGEPVNPLEYLEA